MKFAKKIEFVSIAILTLCMIVIRRSKLDMIYNNYKNILALGNEVEL